MLLTQYVYLYSEFFILSFNSYYYIKQSTQCKKFGINILKIEICLTITKTILRKINFTYSLLASKKYMQQTISNSPMRSYIIQCRTLCKIPELNWLRIGGVLRVSELDHQFFVFLLFFHVDLVQILQGSKITPQSIRSCRTIQHQCFMDLVTQIHVVCVLAPCRPRYVSTVFFVKKE